MRGVCGPAESLVVLDGVDSQLGEWVDCERSQSTGLFTQLLAGRQSLLPHGEYVIQGALQHKLYLSLNTELINSFRFGFGRCSLSVRSGISSTGH
jgi:hypothetical protein